MSRLCFCTLKNPATSRILEASDSSQQIVKHRLLGFSNIIPSFGIQPHQHKMFDLLQSKEDFLTEYLGEGEYYDRILRMEAREEGDGSHLRFTDENCDTSLFPYYAEGKLPAPIPTPSEIVKNGTQIADRTIWHLGPYLVKAGRNVEIFQEAENMLFLERNSTVRTAKLYAAFMSSEVDHQAKYEPLPEGENPRMYYYIVQEFIEGVTVQKFIADPESFIPPRFLMKIGELLGDQLCRLRSVQPKDSKYGRINGRPFQRLPSVSRPEDPASDNFGPFTYEEYVSRVMHSSKVFCSLTCSGPYSSIEKLMYRDAKSVFLDNAGPSDRAVVLSHKDLQLHNVIVKLKYDDEGKVADVEHVVIVDWAFMAWTPPWFEPGDLWAQRYHWDGRKAMVVQTALGGMGQVNTAIVCFWGSGIYENFFRLNHG